MLAITGTAYIHLKQYGSIPADEVRVEKSRDSTPVDIPASTRIRIEGFSFARASERGRAGERGREDEREKKRKREREPEREKERAAG